MSTANCSSAFIHVLSSKAWVPCLTRTVILRVRQARTEPLKANSHPARTNVLSQQAPDSVIPPVFAAGSQLRVQRQRVYLTYLTTHSGRPPSASIPPEWRRAALRQFVNSANGDDPVSPRPEPCACIEQTRGESPAARGMKPSKGFVLTGENNHDVRHRRWLVRRGRGLCSHGRACSTCTDPNTSYAVVGSPHEESRSCPRQNPSPCPVSIYAGVLVSSRARVLEATVIKDRLGPCGQGGASDLAWS